MEVLRFELDIRCDAIGYINDEPYYTSPKIRVVAFLNDGARFDYRYCPDITKLNARFDIVVDIEHLGHEIREYVLLELNDNNRMGGMLAQLGIIKASINRLGSALYMLEDVKKEYIHDLYFYIHDLYSDAISEFEKLKIEKKEKEDEYKEWEKRGRKIKVGKNNE